MLQVGHNIALYLQALGMPRSLLAEAMGKKNSTLLFRSMRTQCMTDTIYDAEWATRIPLSIWFLPTDQFIATIAHDILQPQTDSPLYDTARKRGHSNLETRLSPALIPSAMTMRGNTEPPGLRAFVQSAMLMFQGYWDNPYRERRGTTDLDPEGYPYLVSEALFEGYRAEGGGGIFAVVQDYQSAVREARADGRRAPPAPNEAVFAKQEDELLFSDPEAHKAVWFERYNRGVVPAPPLVWDHSKESPHWRGLESRPHFEGAAAYKANKRGRRHSHVEVRTDRDGNVSVDETLVKAWVANGQDPVEMANHMFATRDPAQREALVRSAVEIAQRLQADPTALAPRIKPYYRHEQTQGAGGAAPGSVVPPPPPVQSQGATYNVTQHEPQMGPGVTVGSPQPMPVEHSQYAGGEGWPGPGVDMYGPDGHHERVQPTHPVTIDEAQVRRWLAEGTDVYNAALEAAAGVGDIYGQVEHAMAAVRLAKSIQQAEMGTFEAVNPRYAQFDADRPPIAPPPPPAQSNETLDTAPKEAHTAHEGRRDTTGQHLDADGNVVIPEDQLNALERETGLRPMGYAKLRETLRKQNGGE